MPSSKTQLVEVVDQLVSVGFDVAVFGGWAEELLGLCAPRAHEDVDLLIVNPNPEDLDVFISGRDEVAAKRLPHKRAYMAFGVLVELFLVVNDDGSWTTEFWAVPGTGGRRWRGDPQRTPRGSIDSPRLVSILVPRDPSDSRPPLTTGFEWTITLENAPS